MNIRPVRIAIVGCGQITDECHLPAALRSRFVEVGVLVDSAVARAERLARKYGLACQCTGDFDAVLGEVEGVLIATPNDSHVALASAALARGIPVLVEKPLTTSYADARQLCDIADRRGTFISVGFVTRHHPVVELMRRLMAEGFFGRIRSFRFEFGSRGGWAPLSNYSVDREKSGGGVLVVSGTHFIDRMLHWFGKPLRFSYADDSYGGVEANCEASLEFESGITGIVRLSKTMDLPNLFEMETDRYRVELPASARDRLILRPYATPGLEMVIRETSSDVDQDYFRIQLDEFARVIRDGGSPTVDGEAGARSVQLCEAFYAARQQLPEPWIWSPRPVGAPEAVCE